MSPTVSSFPAFPESWLQNLPRIVPFYVLPCMHAPDPGSLLSICRELHTQRKEMHSFHAAWFEHSQMISDSCRDWPQCVGDYYTISVEPKPSPCGLSEPGSCRPQLKRGFFTSLLSSQGRPGLIPWRAGADHACRTSTSELLERKKTRPSCFCAGGPQPSY